MNIKQKLIALLLCIALIPSSLVGVVAYVTISNELRHNASEQLASISIKQEQKVNSLLQAKQEEVIKLTNKFDFQVALGQYLANETSGEHANIENILQSKKIEVPDIQAIAVADLRGNTIASTVEGTEGQKIADQTILASGGSTTINIKEDPRDGLNKLYITTHVSVNKKEAAVASVIYRIDDIVAAIQDYTGLGATGETIVAKIEGDKATSLFPLRFDTDAALTKELSSLRLSANNSGGAYSEVVDYRGQEVIASSRSVGFTDWILATKIDSKEAFASIVQLRNSLIGIVLGTSFALAFLAIYFARFFTEPILRIARTSKLIGQGDFSARVDVRRKDEIGALAESINSMGASLNEFVASIEAQRNRLEIILNSTTESILAIDKEGHIIIANQAAAELTGIEVSGMVGKPINEIFTWTQDMQPFTINYDAPGTHIYPDLQYTNATDSTHFVKLIVGRVSGEQEQKAAQTIITIHDETKSRELENMKIDFVSMAAHELRTPLAATRGYLELIKYKESKNITPAGDKYLTQALKSTTELGGLINNLLDVTRIERGTLTLHMEKVDIAASVHQAIQDLRFSAEEKQITLTYEGPEEGCMVVGDPIALREVTNNLLSNAIKYTQANGRIIVSLREEAGVYVVSVKDTGVGIPKQALPNLFQKFYRVHGGLDSGSTGTGLGLFISKSIVERHDGTIKVESEEGTGSTFTFTIPTLTEERLNTAQSEQPQEARMRRQRGWVTKNITR